METLEYIENYVETSLPEILGRLSEEDCDSILDERDNDEFGKQWMKLYNEIERKKGEMSLPKNYNENVRRKAFCKVLDATGNDDMASYISDDIGLIADAMKVGMGNDALVESLWSTYKGGAIPVKF